MSGLTMTATPIRRGSVTLTDCDRELARLAYHLRRATGEDRELLLIDADRWLDLRSELADERHRIKSQGPRGL